MGRNVVGLRRLVVVLVGRGEIEITYVKIFGVNSLRGKIVKTLY
jgi:hypothetical protein